MVCNLENSTFLATECQNFIPHMQQLHQGKEREHIIIEDLLDACTSLLILFPMPLCTYMDEGVQA
jgi:hypothetical protein